VPPAEALAIFAAAVAAGGINAVVGSGSLITFPTLLAFGFPAVIANVSNNVGLVFGNITGSVGYRSELAGQRPVLLRLCVASMAGSLAGAILLLSLPASAFTLIVPVLILLSCALVIVQPKLHAWLARRRAANGRPGTSCRTHHPTSGGSQSATWWWSADDGPVVASQYCAHTPGFATVGGTHTTSPTRSPPSSTFRPNAERVASSTSHTAKSASRCGFTAVSAAHAPAASGRSARAK